MKIIYRYAVGTAPPPIEFPECCGIVVIDSSFETEKDARWKVWNAYAGKYYVEIWPMEGDSPYNMNHPDVLEIRG